MTLSHKLHNFACITLCYNVVCVPWDQQWGLLPVAAPVMSGIRRHLQRVCAVGLACTHRLVCKVVCEPASQVTQVLYLSDAVSVSLSL
jgi:hypothetical protein